jgi:UDP-N-acetylglucosamine acyltransferase
LGAGVILANAATLGGHVHVGDKAFVSGGVVVHQFVRIGESVMCSGNGRFGMDIPPFSIAVERNCVAGLNLVGLRRRGFSREVIFDIKNCYRAVYQEGKLNVVDNAAAALAGGVARTDEGRRFLEFFTGTDSRRHQFVRPRTGENES